MGQGFLASKCWVFFATSVANVKHLWLRVCEDQPNVPNSVRLPQPRIGLQPPRVLPCILWLETQPGALRSPSSFRFFRIRECYCRVARPPILCSFRVFPFSFGYPGVCMSMCMHVCFPLGKTGDVRCRPPELHKFPRGSVRVARPWGFFGAKEQQIPVQKHAYAIRKAGMNAIQMQERLANAGKKSSFHGADDSAPFVPWMNHPTGGRSLRTLPCRIRLAACLGPRWETHKRNFFPLTLAASKRWL